MSPPTATTHAERLTAQLRTFPPTRQSCAAARAALAAWGLAGGRVELKSPLFRMAALAASHLAIVSVARRETAAEAAERRMAA